MLTLAVSEHKLPQVAEVLPPDVVVRSLPAEGVVPREVASADVLLHWGISLERFEACAQTLTRLRWIHTFWAGTERVLPIVQRFRGSPRFTDSRGTYEIPIAEHALGLLLGLVRGLHRHRDAQHRREWQPIAGQELRGRRALVLGAGSIGTRIGVLLQAFGVEVTGIRRRLDRGSPFPLCAPAEIDKMLPSVSVLIASLPETEETKGLLSADRLRALPAGSYVVNVGRGSVLDEAALPALVANGHLAGVALDVFRAEPLPPASPLWRLPGVWVSPHCSGLSPAMNERRLRLFLDNLSAFRAGRPLRNETPGAPP